MKAVSVNWTAEAVVENSLAISGNDGRYMSVASGATAESSASTAMTAPDMPEALIVRSSTARSLI